MKLQQVSIILVLIGITALINAMVTQQLYDASFVTGWILVTLGISIGLIIVMHRYHETTNPSTLSRYHNTHLIIGWVMLYVYFLHTAFKYPNGLLEQIIAALFLIICISGICGLIISHFNKQTPSDLDNHPSPEKLPSYRKTLSKEAENIIIRLTETCGDTLFSEFYDTHLYRYFYTVPRFPINVFGHQKKPKRLLKEIQQLTKLMPQYHNDLSELRELINNKCTVEYHSAWHGIFSTWFYIHKYTSMLLIVFILVHIILVHIFTG